MESYEKKYKDALGWMQSVYPTMTGADKEDAEHFFPELKESEDERIRKWLMDTIKQVPNDSIEWETIDKSSVLAWLEKQGDTNETINKDEFAQGVLRGAAVNLIAWIDYNAAEGNMCLSNMECKDIEDALVSGDWDKIYTYIKKKLEKQGEQILANSAKTCKDEQKPANKVEPKFQNGQWIVWQNKCYKVNYNGCGYELIDQNGLSTSLEYGTVDTSSRLWDITIDAKDGDVLLASDGSIFIFKEVVDLGCKHYIALEEEDGTIQVNDNFAHCWESVTSVCPATKEQRDTLMKAMVDAGYTFDFKKKDLKKIEQKPAEWSEEDEQHIDSLLKRLDGLCRNEFERTRFAISEDEDWIKSLKDRYTWKPSEEQISLLKEAINIVGSKYKSCLNSLYSDLKKL